MIESILYSYIFIVGILLGSFFNVVGIRLADRESIVRPRSHCPNCEHVLNWYELIPIFSYIVQRGKCKKCQLSISRIYPLFELLSGILFVSAPVFFGWNTELFYIFVFTSLCLIISVSDVYKQLIPNKVLLFFLFAYLICQLFIPQISWLQSILGGFIGFAVLFLIALVSKGGMGGGDIKLLGVMGLFLGPIPILLTIFLSSLIGTFFSIFLLITKKASRKSKIPFGPFLACGGMISLYFSETIINWYLSVFL